MLIHRILVAGAICSLLGACVTHIAASTKNNPPPRQKFSDFQAFELQPVTSPSTGKDGGINPKAVEKIQAHLNSDLLPVLGSWNQKTGSGSHTLLVSPRVEDLKFVAGAARFWAGAFAGSSAVVMKVRFTDKETGELVAEPEFFQRTAAMSGAWTFGAQDNRMLGRIAELITSYMQNNYNAAVGGPSGAE